MVKLWALDEQGIPRFQLLQKWQKRPTAPVMYVLFDLLWDNGRDLTGKSVIHRRKRLQEIITSVAGIQVGGYLEKRGVELFQLAKEKGLEGIIAKRKGSTYQPGRRSPDWLKIKARPQQEFVVCGFTEGKGSWRDPSEWTGLNCSSASFGWFFSAGYLGCSVN
jgi:bifunctional non-homologous end joining protein LigD